MCVIACCLLHSGALPLIYIHDVFSSVLLRYESYVKMNFRDNFAVYFVKFALAGNLCHDLTVVHASPEILAQGHE